MAGDWIKMRGSLLTNPKVVRIARTLLKNNAFRDWFGLSRVTACDDTRDVTCDDAPSQGVTRCDAASLCVVTRVTVGALLPLWHSVNECATQDGIFTSADLEDVDGICGVPGMGEALRLVGWIDVLPNGAGLQFCNFSEYNTVGSQRSAGAKTGAERTRAYRDKLRDENVTSRAVTVTSQGDHREEKSREEFSTSLRSVEKRGSRLAADWTLPEDWRGWATAARPDLDADKVADNFRDYWAAKAGKDGVSKDWLAVWRNWVRNERAQPGAVVSRVTVPENSDVARTQRMLEADAAIPRSGPTPEIRARMVALRQSKTVAA